MKQHGYSAHRQIFRATGEKSPRDHPTVRRAHRIECDSGRTAVGPATADWGSELRAIAVETAAWTIETGGDLFGRWQGTPIVLLATKAGPNAQRSNAHFRLDVDCLRQLSAMEDRLQHQPGRTRASTALTPTEFATRPTQGHNQNRLYS